MHGIHCTRDWRKLYEVCQIRTIASHFWRYPGLLVRNGRTYLKHKNKCVHINSEVSHGKQCCTMKWEPCGVHASQCTIDWRKLYEVCQARTIASGFWRYPGVFVIGWTSLEIKIYCFNINSEINHIRYICTHSKPSSAHTSEALVYVKQEKLYLSHSNIMSKQN